MKVNYEFVGFVVRDGMDIVQLKDINANRIVEFSIDKADHDYKVRFSDNYHAK